MFSKDDIRKIKRVQKLLKFGEASHFYADDIRYNLLAHQITSNFTTRSSGNPSLEGLESQLTERKAIWADKNHTIKERKMADDWGDQQGARVTLEEIDNFIISRNLMKVASIPADSTKIVSEDYDEYGYDDYILIRLDWVDIKLDYKYGNCDVGSDELTCTIETSRDKVWFTENPIKMTFGENYADNLIKFFKENDKFLKIDSILDPLLTQECPTK